MKSTPLQKAAKSVYWLRAIGLVLPCVCLPVFLLLPQSDAFARSGCLMAGISIAMVYLNHFYMRDAAVNRELATGATALAEKMPDAWSLLKEKLAPEVVGEMEDLGITSISDLAEAARYTQAGEDTISKFSRRTEFGLGIAGTLIWGFGDLRWFAYLVLVLLFCIFATLFWYRKAILEAFRRAQLQ